MASSGISMVTGAAGGDPTAMLNNQLASALSTMGDAQYWEETISPATIRTSLSNSDPSNPSSTPALQKGMKWLLASISKGRDVSDFYPHVVKLVGVHNLEIRKMVYMYLVQYADHDATTRELSLLSINSFQRGLADAEQLIRALALRVLSSIRIPDIVQIQILGVQKCAKDISPYVRKCAANALAKLSGRCDDMQREMLLEIMKVMLDQDQSTMVLTSAIIAFSELCPQRLELLHPAFRKVCRYLTDMDEWGQVIVVDVLARYCRMFFKEPKAWKGGTAENIDRSRRVRRTAEGISYEASALRTINESDLGRPMPARLTKDAKAPKKVKRRVVKKGFYSDEEDESTEEEVYTMGHLGQPVSTATAMRERNILGIPGLPKISINAGADEDGELDEDHRLLINSAMSLLRSRNAGVVLSVCSLLYYCGVSSVKTRAAMGKALVRIHRDRREIQYVALASIRCLVTECPSAFTPYLDDFFVKGLDPPFSRVLKLEILTSLALEPAAIEAVLGELRTYIRHNDKLFVRAAIRAVGKVAELTRIVYDRYGSKSGDFEKERKAANGIALDCLAGVVSVSRSSVDPVVVQESICVMQNILLMLHSDANTDGMRALLEDPGDIQGLALRKILLTLVFNLSQRKKEADTIGDDDDSNDEESVSTSALQQVSTLLPPGALSSAIWIIGEWLTLMNISTIPSPTMDALPKSKIRDEVIRLLDRAFPFLEPVEKLQAVHFAAKFLVTEFNGNNDFGSRAKPMCEHLLAMARTDLNPDIRDRARFECEIVRSTLGLSHDNDAFESSTTPNLGLSISKEEIKAILLTKKLAPSYLDIEEDSSSQPSFRFGTLSSLVGHKARGSYLSLPPWASKNSPSALREPAAEIKLEQPSPREQSVVNIASSGFYADDAPSTNHRAPPPPSSSESSTSSSSDSDSDSDSDDDSSSSSNDSSSSSDSQEDVTNLKAAVFGNTVPVTNNFGVAPPSKNLLVNFDPQTTQNGINTKSLLNPNDSSSDSDDDSDDSSSSSSSESSDSSSPAAAATANVTGTGTLISVDSSMEQNKDHGLLVDMAPIGKQAPQSSTMNDLRGLVMAPIPVNVATENPNQDNDSSGWTQLVRPELCGGLAVKARYLRGPSRTREASLKSLDPTNAALVCLQVVFANKKTDSMSLRRIKILPRSGQSGSIGAKTVLPPLEIQELKKGQQSSTILFIEFASLSNKDGDLVARLDIRTSSKSSTVEIKPALSHILRPCKLESAQTFDTDMAAMQGLQRVRSKFEISAALCDSVPARILKDVALSPVGSKSSFDGGGKLRLAGGLPANDKIVYVLVECDKASGKGAVTVCCDDALAVNSILNMVKKAIAN